MPEIKKILIIAGEASGDMHGAELMEAVLKKNSDIRFFGMGGERMITQGLEPIRHAREMAFMGFFEVALHYPFIKKVFNEMTALLQSQKPALVILIDYPGFNLRFAQKAHDAGVPVCYYIGPQIWAWGGKRIQKIKRLVDRMIVIFPFEETLYRNAGVPVSFVGHPLKDTFKPEMDSNAFYQKYRIDPKNKLLGLLPGSRKQEVKRLLPEMIRAVQILRNRMPDLQCVMGAAPTLEDDFYRDFLQEDTTIRLSREPHMVMTCSDAVLVASGTATLETALAGTPMVILYKMMPFSYWLGKHLVKVDYIGLVNIVAGKSVAPELIQNQAQADRIAETVLPMLTDAGVRQKMQSALKEVSQKLGAPGASQRTADVVVGMLSTEK